MTSTEIQEMARHVQYEIDEFRNALQKLSGLKESDTDWNGAIELSLLHFRNVRAFLFSESNKKQFPNDLHAQDYLPGWNPTSRHAVFDTTREGINERLAHLTLTRRVDANWPLVEMQKAVEGVISEFGKQLKPEIASWFQLKPTPTIVTFTSYNCSTHCR